MQINDSQILLYADTEQADEDVVPEKSFFRFNLDWAEYLMIIKMYYFFIFFVSNFDKYLHEIINL